MPRQIIAEEQQKSEETKIQNTTTSTTNRAGNSNSNLADDGEKKLVSAGELTKLFHEWDASGNNDLYVNHSLAKRIEEYLEYQEQMDPLKTRLAERIYVPYKCSVSITSKPYDRVLYVNKKKVCTVSTYEYGGRARIMLVTDFKNLLIAMEHPYATWIPENDDMVDFCAFVSDKGGKVEFEFKYGENSIEVTI